jgi:hypothetical protein
MGEYGHGMVSSWATLCIAFAWDVLGIGWALCGLGIDWAWAGLLSMVLAGVGKGCAWAGNVLGWFGHRMGRAWSRLDWALFVHGVGSALSGQGMGLEWAGVVWHGMSWAWVN